MWFFVPRQLIELEYLKGEPSHNPERAKYSKELDFAFFVVNLNMSKAEYEELTPKERLFIYKEWENKTVRDTEAIRNSVYNAVANAFRKKGSRFRELWEKQNEPVDKIVAMGQVSQIELIEKEEGKSWVNKVYEANGMQPPAREED